MCMIVFLTSLLHNKFKITNLSTPPRVRMYHSLSVAFWWAQLLLEANKKGRDTLSSGIKIREAKGTPCLPLGAVQYKHSLSNPLQRRFVKIMEEPNGHIFQCSPSLPLSRERNRETLGSQHAYGHGPLSIFFVLKASSFLGMRRHQPSLPNKILHPYPLSLAFFLLHR
jgi:hypothetical protein